MASLIVDARDQKFVLYELLKIEDLCRTAKYADFSRETFDMVLAEGEKLLAAKFKSVEYYKEFAIKKKSIAQ